MTDWQNKAIDILEQFTRRIGYFHASGTFPGGHVYELIRAIQDGSEDDAKVHVKELRGILGKHRP